jgi:predicted transcriptional regulator
MMRKRRDERYMLRLSALEKRALQKLADERDMPASQIIRQALKSLMAEAGEAGR